MTTLEYLKEEGWRYYLGWPGIWPSLLITILAILAYSLIPGCHSRTELLKAICGSAATITGIMLALGAAAITFQLGTFSVTELQNFVGNREAMQHLDITRASAKWTIEVLIGTFVLGVVLSLLIKLPELEKSGPFSLLGISVFVIMVAISHAGFAARAAFDFANLKIAVAQALEGIPADQDEMKQDSLEEQSPP